MDDDKITTITYIIFFAVAALLISLAIIKDKKNEQNYKKAVIQYEVVDKEMHTELDPTTQFFFGIHTTKSVYTLVIRRGDDVRVLNVEEEEYYRYDIGDVYFMTIKLKK